MKLSWTGARWELSTRNKAEWEDAKAVGFHFDWKSKITWTGLTEVAEKYKHLADLSAQRKFQEYAQLISASKAVTSNLVIHAPEGLAYLPFQKACIEFGLSRPNTLIADEMGLGKTIEAIGIIDHDPLINNILIIPPASLIINWERELLKWMTKKLSGDFATSTKVPNCNIVIANYDKIWNLREQLLAREWDAIILDEEHYLKNEDAKRTQAVFGHREKRIRPLEARRRKLALTGTPILNRPVELWPMLQNFDPEGLGADFWLFAKRFCGCEDQTSGMRDFSGASNLDVLQQRLRASIMIRRLKKDVLPELPPKRRQILPIPVPKEVAGIIQAELNFYDQNRSEIDNAVAKADAEAEQQIGDRLSFDQASRDLKDCKGIIFERMAELRKATGVAKIPYLIQHIENKLQEVEKVFFIAHHHEVMSAIAQHFGPAFCVQHNGNMSEAARQQSVDRFENDPSVRIFDGGITTAVGYTILKGVYQLFGEEDWRPAIVSQAEDRAHRIGQRFNILSQHMVFDGSLDARMVKKTVAKQEIIDAAIG